MFWFLFKIIIVSNKKLFFYNKKILDNKNVLYRTYKFFIKELKKSLVKYKS